MFIGGEILFFAAFFATAAFILRGAFRTLNEQQVAAIVLAVGVGVAGGAAIVALGYYIFRDALTEALIEHKVLSLDF